MCVEDVAFACVDVYTAHVNLGFFQGASLRDSAGLLQVTGRYMRHVRIRPGVPLDGSALEILIVAAYRDIVAKLKADRAA
jgi:hypothetical protein